MRFDRFFKLLKLPCKFSAEEFLDQDLKRIFDRILNVMIGLFFFHAIRPCYEAKKRNKSCQFIPRNDPRAFVSLTKLKVKTMRQYHNYNNPNHCYTTRLHHHHHHHHHHRRRRRRRRRHHHHHQRHHHLPHHLLITITIIKRYNSYRVNPGVTPRKPLRQKTCVLVQIWARNWYPLCPTDATQNILKFTRIWWGSSEHNGANISPYEPIILREQLRY